MNDSVESYRKLILEKLYKGFINKPPNRIKNNDLDKIFFNIQNNSNFNIAIESLCKNDFLYGRNVIFGNPPFLQITGEGLVYYEKTYVIPSDERVYTLLVSKLLKFLSELSESKYDKSKYIVDDSNARTIKVEIPFSVISDILKNDYYYKLDDLKWSILYFTTEFINKLGRNRIIQLYEDLSSWILQNRWVDVAINMGAIIEYCIDYYAEEKELQEFFKRGKLNESFSEKLRIILQNSQSSSVNLYNPQYKATWKRIQNVLKDYRNYIHITKLVKEGSPLDKTSIKNIYTDFQIILNILLNL